MEESEVLELDREDLAKTTNGRQGVALILFCKEKKNNTVSLAQLCFAKQIIKHAVPPFPIVA